MGSSGLRSGCSGSRARHVHSESHVGPVAPRWRLSDTAGELQRDLLYDNNTKAGKQGPLLTPVRDTEYAVSLPLPLALRRIAREVSVCRCVVVVELLRLASSPM